MQCENKQNLRLDQTNGAMAEHAKENICLVIFSSYKIYLIKVFKNVFFYFIMT